VPTPNLEPDTRRVWVLIGVLSDALWRRVGEPGFSLLEHLLRKGREYRAESADEVAIWDELTAPHNYPTVVRYVEQRRGQASDAAAELNAAILEAVGTLWRTPTQRPIAAPDRRSLRRGAGPGFPGSVRHHQDKFAGGHRVQAFGTQIAAAPNRRHPTGAKRTISSARTTGERGVRRAVGVRP